MTRVIIHDKSSLAPEGKPIAFSLGNEKGFEWIGEYEITADELLSGKSGMTQTNTERVKEIITALLSDGKELPSDEIQKQIMSSTGISERTVQLAKSELKRDSILGYKRIGKNGPWINFLKTEE